MWRPRPWKKPRRRGGIAASSAPSRGPHWNKSAKICRTKLLSQVQRVGQTFLSAFDFRQTRMSAPPFGPLALIHIRVGAQVLENLLPLLLVEHQIDALAAVAPLNAALGAQEQAGEGLPVAVAAAPSHFGQGELLPRAEAFQQFIIQREEKLT